MVAGAQSLVLGLLLFLEPSLPLLLPLSPLAAAGLLLVRPIDGACSLTLSLSSVTQL